MRSPVDVTRVIRNRAISAPGSSPHLWLPDARGFVSRFVAARFSACTRCALLRVPTREAAHCETLKAPRATRAGRFVTLGSSLLGGASMVASDRAKAA